MGVLGVLTPAPQGVPGALDGAAEEVIRGVAGAIDGLGVAGPDWLVAELAEVAVPGAPICRRRSSVASVPDVCVRRALGMTDRYKAFCSSS